INQNVSWISNDNLLIVIKGQYNDTMPSSSLETKFIFNGKTEYVGYGGSSYDLNGPYTFSTSIPMTPGETVEAEETTETKVTWEPVDTSTTDGNLTVTNKPNKVDFIKVDGDNNALAGVVFELRQKIGETYSSLTPEVTATSDANGYFSFENIYPGDYGVFEITPPEGYPT